MINYRRLQRGLTYISLFGLAAGQYVGLFIGLLLLSLTAKSLVDKRVKLDINCFMITAFVIAYAVFSKQQSGFLFSIAIVVCYLLGLQTTVVAEGQAQFQRMCVWSIGLGFLYHCVRVLIENVSSGFISKNIYLIDYITGQSLAPTHYATMIFFPICLVCMVANYAGEQKGKKTSLFGALFSIITIAVYVVFTFVLGRRILLLTAALLMLFSLVWKKKITYNRFLFATIILILAVCFYSFDLLGVRTKIENSELLSRIVVNGFESGRGKRVIYAFEHFFDNMLGGMHMREHVGYIHNFWLDIYDVAGIFAVIPIVWVSVKSVAVIINKKAKSVMGEQNRYLFWLLLIVIFVQFITEPAYESEIIFVWCAFFVLGMINSYACKGHVSCTVKG